MAMMTMVDWWQDDTIMCMSAKQHRRQLGCAIYDKVSRSKRCKVNAWSCGGNF